MTISSDRSCHVGWKAVITAACITYGWPQAAFSSAIRADPFAAGRDEVLRPVDDRDVGSIAATSPAPGRAQSNGSQGGRYSAAGPAECEFAIAVADDWHGLGLAPRLLEALIPIATVESSEDPGVRPARCDLAQP